LAAVHRNGAKRASWLGFAVFGWSYLVLAVVPAINARLITTKALDYLDSKAQARRPRRPIDWFLQAQPLARETPPGAAPGFAQLWVPDSAAGTLLRGWDATTENFILIGHSLFALLAGCAGGQLARSLCRDASGDIEHEQD
jgi:hypothetical protein